MGPDFSNGRGVCVAGSHECAWSVGGASAVAMWRFRGAACEPRFHAVSRARLGVRGNAVRRADVCRGNDVPRASHACLRDGLSAERTGCTRLPLVLAARVRRRRAQHEYVARALRGVCQLRRCQPRLRMPPRRLAAVSQTNPTRVGSHGRARRGQPDRGPSGLARRPGPDPFKAVSRPRAPQPTPPLQTVSRQTPWVCRVAASMPRRRSREPPRESALGSCNCSRHCHLRDTLRETPLPAHSAPRTATAMPPLLPATAARHRNQPLQPRSCTRRAKGSVSARPSPNCQRLACPRSVRPKAPAANRRHAGRAPVSRSVRPAARKLTTATCEHVRTSCTSLESAHPRRLHPCPRSRS